ncbi:hypothetical protein [Sphingomonas melonis]|uniref:Integrase n=1 Tax=Sphingomonas melonis TaxID=152682 RepID=A0A7Y9K0R8_9SPHN|nr:hypothetical protein [Sphingomonas melonis]NYD89181.1 hypothetical protein [Sphingomonas melonis]
MKTEEIVKLERKSGVHAQDASQDGWVSSSSKWTDSMWKLDSPTARMRDSDCTIVWDDDIPACVTACLKVLAWSMLVKRPTGKPMALSNFSRLGQKLKYLGRWMAWRNHADFGTITRTAVQVYRKDLVDQLATDDDGKPREVDVETGTVAGYLLLLQYIYEQGPQLTRRGVRAIPIAPFEGSSAWETASSIVPEIEGFTPALPDEVVLPIVHQAHSWLGTPARDILRMQAICIEERERGRSDLATTRTIRKRLEEFEFGSIEPGGPAWHPPFRDYLLAYTDRPDDTRSNTTEYYGLDLVRRLISNLCAACVIVVRYQSGVRHGEIFSFKPGVGDDGLPVCVKIEGSLTGAYDMFFVEGVITKGWDHPTDTRWLLAGRLSGDPELPDAVRALVILSELGRPWREWAMDEVASGSLLIQIGTKGLPRSPGLIRPLSSEQLAEMMKDFIEDRVDLSMLDAADERLAEYVRTRGRSVQSRQWRKTWANWMIRVDKRLLPAISQQFHHQSIIMTEEGYIGKDAMQLGLVESAAMSRAVSFMRRAIDGDKHVGGAMRKAVQEDLGDLRHQLAGISGAERNAGIETWLVRRDVRPWFSPHGICFVGLTPTRSRCHEAAGTTDWLASAPAFAHRTPRMCSGCAAFAIDEDDLPFWIERYLENRAIWDDAVSRHMEDTYVVAEERWKQSVAVLQSLGVDIATLKAEMADAPRR